MKYKTGDVIVSMKNTVRQFSVEVLPESDEYRLTVLSHTNSEKWKVGETVTKSADMVDSLTRLLTKLDEVLK